MTTFEQLAIWLDVATIAVALFAIIYAHTRTRDAARTQETQQLRERVTVIEAQLKETPTSKSLHEVALGLERLSGNLNVVVERTQGMKELFEQQQAVVVRLESYLKQVGCK